VGPPGLEGVVRLVSYHYNTLTLNNIYGYFCLLSLYCG